MWNLPAPPGFQGLHPDKPLRIYQRHLPHWRQEGATYFVTFRLGDSLPQAKLDELAGLRKEWERLHPPPQPNAAWEKLAREMAERVERWLDQGHGSCVLKHPHLAAHVVNTLHHFDTPSRTAAESGTAFPGRHPESATGSESEMEEKTEEATAKEGRPTGESNTITPRYELGCYFVMANHVHAIVRPLDGQTQPLENIVGSWKQFSSGKFNKAQGTKRDGIKRKVDLWQDETFDRIIRDEEHLWRVIQYIGRNPDNAHVPRDSCPLWIRPEWESLGWTFEWRRGT